MVLNETLNNTFVPISVNATPPLLSYIVPTIVSAALFSIILLLPNFQLLVSWIRIRGRLKRLSFILDKNLIVMSHRQLGLFGSMITMEDVMQIEGLMRKFGKDKIAFIINTFGGDLLASVRLAQLVKDYGADVYIPKYAWSGGSLASISSAHIFMGKNATLSPVDVQLGSFLKIFSAKHWMKILKTKGKKVNDDTIAMAQLSRELLNEQKETLLSLVKDRDIDKKEFLKVFLSGGKSHAYQIGINELKEIGFDAKEIDMPIMDEIIEKSKKQVFGYKLKVRSDSKF